MKLRDTRLSTYGGVGSAHLQLHAIPIPHLEISPYAKSVCERYLAHRFDLLGSGWVDVSVAASAPLGTMPRSARRDSERIADLLPALYRPIDWHRDHQAGYRWPLAWHGDIVIGRPAGVDIKIPWELGRMQHLPQLAVVSSRRDLAGISDTEGTLSEEIRSQIIDFVSANPPRFGVHWCCAMEVAIRAVNWLVACDVLAGHGWRPDTAFADVLAASLLDHGRFIASHLEWTPHLRTNHYLSDLVGLLCISAHIASPETDRWLAFAAEELVDEMARQFLPDGCNFEGSTSYHCFSTELALLGTAALAGCGRQRCSEVATASRGWRPHANGWRLPRRKRRAPSWWREGIGAAGDHLERIARALEVIAVLARPDGQVPQVGDNDSGRVLKLAPRWYRVAAQVSSEMFGPTRVVPDGDDLLEDPMDHRDVLRAAAGLFAGDPPAGPGASVEAAVVAGLAGGARVAAPVASMGPDVAPSTRGSPTAWSDALAGGRHSHMTHRFPSPEGRRIVVETARAFPDGGLVVWKGPALYLLVRCGPRGQWGVAGHDHNDQLSFELVVNGTDRTLDPGTYVYTRDPGERNRYRSAEAHTTPVPDQLMGRLGTDLFSIQDPASGEVTEFSDRHFVGRVSTASGSYLRRIVIAEDGVVVEDLVPTRPALSDATGPADAPLGLEYPAADAVALHDDGLQVVNPWGTVLAYSPGYGLRVAPGATTSWRGLTADGGGGSPAPEQGDPATEA